MANKKLKTINMILIGCSDEPASLTAADTVEKPIASYALESFKAEKYMDFESDGTEYLVPFHAVDHIIITEATESVEDKPNPYGCEGGGRNVDLVTITVYQGKGYALRCDTPVGTFEAEKGVPTKVPESVMPSDLCCADDYDDVWIVENGSAEIRNDGVYITAEVDAVAYPRCMQTI